MGIRNINKVFKMIKSYAIGVYFEELQKCEVKIVLGLNPQNAIYRAINAINEDEDESYNLTVEEFQQEIYKKYKIVLSKPALVKMF